MTLTGDPATGARPQPPPGAPPRARTRRRRSQLPLALFAADAACVLAVLLATAAQRAPSVAVLGVSVLLAHCWLGLYRPRLELSVLDDLPLLLGGALAGVGVGAIAEAAFGAGRVDRCAVAAVAVQTCLVVLARTGTHVLRRRARRSGRVAHRTLVVGCGGLGAQLVELLQRGEHGLLPVGFVDDDPRLPPELRPVPVLGELAELPELVRRHRAAVVLIGYSNVPEAVVVDVLRGCHGLDVEIFAVPRFWQVSSSHRLVESLRGVPLVQLRRPAFRAASWPLKRVLDVTASAAGLVVLSPLLLLCAAAVRADLGPGVLFRQERVGLGGRRFEVLKLRTVPHRPAGDGVPRWGVGEEELSALGRWMRRLSLDELPQLWNVLRGDMSLVGPRPERPYFVERFEREHEDYLWRHRVPCGITGWAQVHGLRGDTSIDERARFDNHYVENWSLWLDVKILLRTVVQVLAAAGR
ncbi:sugar transferase [Kineococcus indalonis]|uniref:sugar transferase n=1 Tax=Kineococcus indalonis TaxID=2696566 RepID=UPI00141338A1|nr:sugar transferase [Kineococcus indalonis]NAZ87547.1 exopolysaccharide biosynthesis polyprenyl glycosylphosphotransferase [Kineococcus indalonis]